MKIIDSPIKNKETSLAVQTIKKLKFEYMHWMSVITNPTPDVTKRDKEKARIILTVILSVLCLYISTAYLLDSTYNPFLYFRF